MKLYLIRHAEAVEATGDMSDADRPLTPEGHSQCRRLAAGLKRAGVTFDAVLHSPLKRAVETVEGVMEGAEGAARKVCDALAPGGRKRKVLDIVRDLEAESVALVGHNPDLSELTGWFMGDKGVGLDLAKAAAACLEFDGRAAKGGGTLVWLVTPVWLPGE
jgi:phosphohistidine phosphatase